jgi:hypothetical protein
MLRGVLIAVGNRLELATELEGRLLQLGTLVVRTRVADRDALLRLVHTGAVVVAESQSYENVTVFGANGDEHVLRSTSSADEIVTELQDAGVIAAGEKEIR